MPHTCKKLKLQTAFDSRVFQEGWHMLGINSGPAVFPTIMRVHQTHTDPGVHHNLMSCIPFTNCIIVPVFCGCAEPSGINLSEF